MKPFPVTLLTCFLSACASTPTTQPTKPIAVTPQIPATQPAPPTAANHLNLGNFSLSLAVKDLAASRAFYEKLGFHVIAGVPAHYLILQNETTTLGLFHGMFDKNTLTFNPGWDRSSNTLPNFTDIREIQQTLKTRGLTPTLPADESTTGPAFFMLLDPDGNPILLDQHVPSPNK